MRLSLLDAAGSRVERVLPVVSDRVYPLDLGLRPGDYTLKAHTFRGAVGTAAFSVDGQSGPPVEVTVLLK